MKEMNDYQKPPGFAVKLLELLCRGDYLEEIQGDLYEAYYIRKKRMPGLWAQCLFVYEVIISLKFSNLKTSQNKYFIMTGNYIKVGIRNFKNNPLYSGINILGLSLGLACTILLFMFVKNEYSYDKHFHDYENIYRVSEKLINASGEIEEYSAAAPWSTGVALQNDYPDAKVVRMYQAWQKDPLITHNKGEMGVYEDKIFFVDTTFFDVFNGEAIKGTLSSALDNPQSVVLSESTANRYFEDEDPIGKVLYLENALELTVTAVVKDFPPNTHFHYDFLIPLLNIGDIFQATRLNWQWRGWYWNPVHTYIKLPGRYSWEQFNQELELFVEKNVPERLRDEIVFVAQPLKSIHLKSHLYQEIEKNRTEESVLLSIGIALFILTIAIINFVNLTTAKSMQRAREVAMRKVMGSSRRQLILQFFGESVLTCFLALIIALLFMTVMISPFENLLDTNLNLSFILQTEFMIWIFLGTFFVGILAGLYPAFLISGFSALTILKAGKVSRRNDFAGIFRKALLVFQFVISVMLIISAIVVYQQHRFLVNKDIGFDKEEILMISIIGTDILEKRNSFKEELLKLPQVISASAVSDIVGEDIPNRPFRIKGYEQTQNLPGLFTDADFVKTFGVKLKEGRNFDKNNAGDRQSWLINEKMEEVLKDKNWEGQEVGFNSGRKIIGQVENFHFYDLRQPVRPLFIGFQDGFLSYMAVRVNPGNVYETVSGIEKVWKMFEKDRPFTPFFLDEKLNSMYASEDRIGTMISYFSVLAIIIASLGLFGLSTYTIQLRTREMSIRKVLGATVFNNVFLISKNFLVLALVANILALPLAYYFLNMWLDNFIYKVQISYVVFAFVAAFTIIISMAITGIQTFKASSENPVNHLKDE